MYMVRNMTDHPIILSDIRATIPEKRILDLEMVASPHLVESSHDLKTALNRGWLAVVQKSVVHSNVPIKPQIKIVEKIIEKPIIVEKEVSKDTIDETTLERVVRKVISDENSSKKLDEVLAALRNRVSEPLSNNNSYHGPNIDEDKLAEIQQKAIESMTKNMESFQSKKHKRITLNNADELQQRASEL